METIQEEVGMLITGFTVSFSSLTKDESQNSPQNIGMLWQILFVVFMLAIILMKKHFFLQGSRSLFAFLMLQAIILPIRYRYGSY